MREVILKRKKIFLAMLLMVMVGLCGCAGDDKTADGEEFDESFLNPYSELNFEDYLILPDYDSYEFSVNVEAVTDEDVEESISTILLEAGSEEVITEGIAEDGDKVKVSFHVVSEEGEGIFGLDSEGILITLGEEDMVSGFQEGIMGHRIGETFNLKISFPETYDVKPEVAGKTLEFEITLIEKYLTIPAKLDDDFVKANSEAKSVEEYREYIRENLEEEAREIAVQEAKNTFFLEIESNVVMKDLPQDKVQEFKEVTDQRYRKVAEDYEIEWEEFVLEVFSVTADNYDAHLLSYAREMIKQEMILYAIAEKEGIEITSEEYKMFLQEQLQNSGYKSEEEFEAAAGMTINEYVSKNHLIMNYLFDKDMDKIYERLNK